MTVVVVGKSSFLAQEVAKHPGSKDWRFLSHGDAVAQPGWLDNAATVVNFAFPPQFKTRNYDRQSDVDSILARMIGARSIRYIMLSSRMVYGQTNDGFGLLEMQEPKPTNHYGTAKLAVERALEGILGDRLTVLRLSNLFGFEPGRPTFFGQMMKTLKAEDRIVFDMAAETQRDFFAVHRFSEALMKITAASAPGIFNVGSGLATKCGDVATWLMEGFGKGRLEVSNPVIRDQFSLDVSKACAKWDLPILTSSDIREDILGCGKRLKA
jgi:UDP-glucose 4-epimerase